MKHFILISFLFCSACANLTTFQPLGLLEIPEQTSSQGARSFDYGIMPGFEYTAIDDASDRPPVWDPQIEEDRATIFSRLRLPIQETGFEFTIGAFAFGLIGGAKYQFFGPQNTTAQTGDMSLALIAQGTYSVGGEKDGDQNGTFGAGGYGWHAEINNAATTTALLFGVRAADNFLIYGGPAYNVSHVSAEIVQDPTSNGSDPGGTYTFSDRVKRFGPELGVYWNATKKMSFQLEAFHFNTKSNELRPQSDDITLAAAMRWDF